MRTEAIYVASDGNTAADEPRFSLLALALPPLWAVQVGHAKTALGLAVAPFAIMAILFSGWGNTPVIGAILIVGDWVWHIAFGFIAWRWHRFLLKRDGYVPMAALRARRGRS